jgi:hypothetical protein
MADLLRSFPWRRGLSMVALIAVAIVGVALTTPSAHASPRIPQGPIVRKLLAHAEGGFSIHGTTSKNGYIQPNTSSSHWSTDTYELCGAGGTQCYAVEGDCQASYDGFAVSYTMSCRVLHGSTVVWSYGVTHSSAFNLGSPQESVQTGAWKTQLWASNRDDLGHVDANAPYCTNWDDSLCAAPPWGVTASTTI